MAVIFLIVLVVLAIIAILVIFGSRNFPLNVEKYVGIECDLCTNDLSNLDDCKTQLEIKKSDPIVINFAKKLNVNLENVTKMVKKKSTTRKE